jgi:hypothetical protein
LSRLAPAPPFAPIRGAGLSLGPAELDLVKTCPEYENPLNPIG